MYFIYVIDYLTWIIIEGNRKEREVLFRVGLQSNFHLWIDGIRLSTSAL